MSNIELLGLVALVLLLCIPGLGLIVILVQSQVERAMEEAASEAERSSIIGARTLASRIVDSFSDVIWRATYGEVRDGSLMTIHVKSTYVGEAEGISVIRLRPQPDGRVVVSVAFADDRDSSEFYVLSEDDPDVARDRIIERVIAERTARDTDTKEETP